MQKKIERKESIVTINIPFQKTKFINYTLVSLVIFIIAYALGGKFPSIGNFAVFIIGVYFLPTAIVYDLTSEYETEFKVPKIHHPRRFSTMLLNVLFGWTFIGWLFSLKMALTPGQLEVTKVEFI